MHGGAEHFADQYVDTLLGEQVRLGLIPASSGADTPTAIGWTSAFNHDNDTAPPTTTDQALRATAEHFAFCPDNIWSSNLNTIREYAEAINGINCWTFWWD